MRVLLLVQKEQRVILDRLYDAIAQYAEHCDTCWLSSDEQANLKQWFASNINYRDYDRIVFMLRFKKEIKQVRFLRTVPNMVILEHDAYQNYIDDKYQGKYSKQYRSMPWVRVISSGATVTRKLQQEGFDAHFVAKGYDQALLKNQGRERDIELGFLGSIKSKTYNARRELLEALSQSEPLVVRRTKSGDEYAETLNRIRFFISADVGFGEYMIKNFEAMACGCVVFAWNQGTEENNALGFKDMENIVLYQSLEELREKLARLRSDHTLAQSIAMAGQELAENHYSWDAIGARVVETMRPSLRQPKISGIPGFKHYSWQ